MPGNSQKGKRDVMVTACTTPWPFNVILPESRGPINAVKEILHYGFYKFVGAITKPGTKKSKEVSSSLMEKAERLRKKLG
jgi:hypothetical protein